MSMGIKALLGAVSSAALAMAAFSSPALAATTALPSLAEPSLSPDGSEIAFASGGDIWTVAATGGAARLLVTDPATESRPLYSPDGSNLAFTSTRSGSNNIYVLTIATGEVKRITYSESGETLDAWSRDGKWLYFTSSVNDVARLGDIFRVSAAGGTPLEVSRERFLSEFQSAPSPDGRAIALMAKGMSNTQWWRNGHSHIDETELWLKPLAEAAPYQQLLPAGAKNAFPMWRPDGGALYYMSDASGTENIWRLTLGGKPEQVTRFTDGRVLWPTIGYDGKTIVFERGFSIWSLDTATGKTVQTPITLRGAPASTSERRLNESKFDSLAVSPDGKKLALVVRGEIFAVSAKDGGAAQRITRTPGVERDVAWSKDSRKLIYVSERDLAANLYEYDFQRQRARPDHRDRPQHHAGRFPGREGHRLHPRRQGAARHHPGRRRPSHARCGALQRRPERLRRHDRGLVAGQQVAGLRRHRQQGVRERPCDPGGGRRGAADQLPRQRPEQRPDRLVPGRQVHPGRHRPAQRDGADAAHRSAAEHAEVSRGRLPRPVQAIGHTGQARAVPRRTRRGGCREGRTGQARRRQGREGRQARQEGHAGAHRLRRHPRARLPASARHGRRRAGDQPGWKDAAVPRHQRRPDQPLH